MTRSVPPGELPIVEAADEKAWSRWLEEHHAESRGVWLRIGKKGGLTSVTYAEALDEALCFGWIDAQKRSHDATSFLQKFTPRGPRSIWSQINRGKVAALTESGRMRAAGIAAVEAAKADGRWDAAYAPQSKATVPDDFQAAIDADPEAKRFFATLRAGNRYALIFRVETAKRAETRAKRIEQFVAMLARGETIHG